MSTVPKSGAVWLGSGDFTHQDDRYVATEEARRLFLEAIREEAPIVLAKLADKPLTLFRPVLERALNAPTVAERDALFMRLSWTGALGWGRFKYADRAHDPDAVAFRVELLRWAQDYKLDSSDDDWILDRACDTLRGWCTFPDLFERDGPTWNVRVEGITVELTDDEQAITFPAYTWNPQSERTSVARERIRSDLASQLAQHLDRIATVAAERGLTKTPEMKSGTAHFQWLAAYQVLPLDWESVAERFCQKDANRVQRDARAIAATIGLAVRQGRRVGRPRKHAAHIVRYKRANAPQ